MKALSETMSHCHEQRQKQFIEEYGELFRYISKYVSFRIPKKEEAEEVIGEIFLKGYAKLNTFDEERGSMRQWFTGIAHRVIVDYWKNVRPTVAIDDAFDLCCEMDHLAINNAIDASMQYENIIQNLSPEARSLFTLRYVDGLTYEEIASYVGKKPSAIRTYFSRAFTRIRQSNTL